jgi:hypothetical protein
MNEPAKFVGDYHPEIMRAIPKENAKEKDAKAKGKSGHWEAGRWLRDENGKPFWIIPQFIVDDE